MAEKKINGQTYKVDPLLATEAILLQARLLKVVGPAVDRLPEVLSAAAGGDETEKARANATAISAFMDIFQRADPREIVGLVKDVVEIAMVMPPSGQYRKVDLDGDFTGNLSAMAQVAVFVLQEQFRDFFSGVLANGSLGNRVAH